MSASAMLLHRMLITSAGRGWESPATSACESAGLQIRFHPLGNVSEPANLAHSGVVNVGLGANPDRPESPQYLPASERMPPHA
jgi:hypothetical protein